MPPKSAKSPAGGAASAAGAPSKAGKAKKAGGGGSAADFKGEDVLQAVLLADSFQVKFRPLTVEQPKVLLPLLNIPLLEYSLEFLVSAGVGELFVFCRSHAEQITAYIESVEAGTKWKKSARGGTSGAAAGGRSQGITVRTIVGTNCYTFGEAMRFIEQLDIIKRDFVLISGDVVTNLKLETALAAHKQRVEQDKRNMMTLIFKQASHAHRTRPLSDDAVLAIDPTTQQLLFYQNDRNESRVALESTLLAEMPASIQLRYDLMDSHISICTPEVLMLFADNFDWNTFHTDFLGGVLGSEILGNKLFVHTISRDEYAARCEDLRSYDAISKDILHRWTYPLVPDNNLLGASSNAATAGGSVTTTYRHTARGNIYKEENVTVSREARVQDDVLIGGGTTIGAKTSVRQSVIGRNCTIGSNVQLTGSYVWSNVTIEDGAVVDRAILADGVIVRAGARIGLGAILSFGVVIGPNHTVPPYTRITTARDDDKAGDDDDDEAIGSEDDAKDDGRAAGLQSLAAATAGQGQQWLASEVGVGGIGRVYTGQDEEDDEDEDEDADEDEEDEKKSASARFPYKPSELNSIAPNPAAVAAWLQQQFAEESEDEWDEEPQTIEEEDAEAEEDAEDPALANQLGSSGAARNLGFHKFAHEVEETLKRGHYEKLSLENISLEINGLKFSHNPNMEEFAHAVFLAIFAIVQETVVRQTQATGGASSSSPIVLDPTSSKVVMQALGTTLKQWWKVLAKFGKLVSDQVSMVHGLEQACLASGFITSAPSPAHAAAAVAATTASLAHAAASLYTPLFTPTLQLLYDPFPLFSEDAIVAWADAIRTSDDGESHILYKQSDKFRTWLAEADEDEDDEEED